MKWRNLRNPHPLGSFARTNPCRVSKCTRFLTSWSRSELTRPLATIDHNHSLEMTFFATWLALRATALAELQCLRNLRQNRRTKVSLTRKKALIELWGNNQTRAHSSLPFYSIWTAH